MESGPPQKPLTVPPNPPNIPSTPGNQEVQLDYVERIILQEMFDNPKNQINTPIKTIARNLGFTTSRTRSRLTKIYEKYGVSEYDNEIKKNVLFKRYKEGIEEEESIDDVIREFVIEVRQMYDEQYVELIKLMSFASLILSGVVIFLLYVKQPIPWYLGALFFGDAIGSMAMAIYCLYGFYKKDSKDKTDLASK